MIRNVKVTIRSSPNLPRSGLLEQRVGRGAADRVVPEVNVDWRRPGQRRRYFLRSRMWDTEEPASNEPLTDDMIANAERQLGVRLPRSYLDALRTKNGGSTTGQYIKLPTQHVPDHLSRYVDQGYIAVLELNGIGSGDDTILETDYFVGEWGLPSPIVILSGEGHWWIVFDYRVTPENPPIVFLDSDSGDTLHLSNDFASFLSSLVPHKHVFDSDGNFIG